MGVLISCRNKLRRQCGCAKGGKQEADESGDIRGEISSDVQIHCKFLGAQVCNLLLPGLDTTITSSLSAPATEFTELSSRKTSNVSSFFQSQLSKSSWLSSSNPYEDTLLQTKDEQTDRWEFPRHHLKFYGILGESLNLQA